MTIKVADKEYPLRMTMGAMLRYKRETGTDVSQMNAGDVESLLTLMYCCTASACNADKVDFDMDLETFADNMDAESFNAASSAMFSSATKSQKKSK